MLLGAVRAQQNWLTHDSGAGRFAHLGGFARAAMASRHDASFGRNWPLLSCSITDGISPRGGRGRGGRLRAEAAALVDPAVSVELRLGRGACVAEDRCGNPGLARVLTVCERPPGITPAARGPLVGIQVAPQRQHVSS
jgi:hypothetical protein